MKTYIYFEVKDGARVVYKGLILTNTTMEVRAVQVAERLRENGYFVKEGGSLMVTAHLSQNGHTGKRMLDSPVLTLTCE